MNKTLNINIMSCLDKIYERMNDNYNFAYPNGNFELNRAHPVLCRFSVFHATLITLFDKDNLIACNELEKIFFQQVIGNAKTIAFDKEWSYPNGSFSENRAPSSLNCIETSMKNYRSAIKLLGNHCFSDKKANFDLVHFVKNISCLTAYNYAYPNNYYSEDKAHAAIQMLLTITENVIHIVNSVVAPDKEVDNIISNYSTKLESAKQTLLKSYPNNQFNSQYGHACLNQFIETWKNAKEVCVPQLTTYFEKQALIADYEAKLQQQKHSGDNYHLDVILNKTPIDKKEEVVVVDEPVVPVVRKVKSLL